MRAEKDHASGGAGFALCWKSQLHPVTSTSWLTIQVLPYHKR